MEAQDFEPGFAFIEGLEIEPEVEPEVEPEPNLDQPQVKPNGNITKFATILGRRLSILRLFIACKSIKTSVRMEKVSFLS